MKQNDINLEVWVLKNQRDFFCLLNICSYQVKDEFVFMNYFFFFESDCEQNYIEI